MEDSIQLIILTSYGIILWVYGIKIHSLLATYHKDIYEKYGEPDSIFNGIKEYKFIFNFIIFSGYKYHELDSKLLKNIKIYKTLLFSLIPTMLIMFNLS